MRLVAVNQHTALYVVEDKQGTIDAGGFISALLDVRNAKHLITLLIDYADTITVYRYLHSNQTAWDVGNPEPWFSEGSIRDGCDTLRVAYESKPNDVQGRFDSATTTMLMNKLDSVKSMEDLECVLHRAKRREVVTVNLDKLHDIRERWESLLTYAAIGGGVTPPQGFITADEKNANALCIHHEAIERAMPEGRFDMWEYFTSHNNKTTREVGHEFGRGLHMNRSHQLCVFNLVNVPNDPQLLLRLTCGRIAADGINAWAVGGGLYDRGGILQEVAFDPDKGFHVTDQTDLIIDALRSVIVNDKVRLCPICGKPFIPQRKSRKYCSDSCKQRPYMAKKEGR